MQRKSFANWSIRSAVVALVLLAACSENGMAPLDVKSTPKPNFVITTVTTNWDFAALLNLGAGCHVLSNPQPVTQAPFGTIAISATGAAPTSKGQELAPGASERGLGLDVDATAGCQHDEVGDLAPGAAYNGILYLNLAGVLPVGSLLTEVGLGSLQIGEGWLVSYSTTGIGGAYTLLSSGCSTGGNTPGDTFLITTSLSTTNLVLRFQKNTACPGNATTDNDYTVRFVTTTHQEGTAGCTLTQGYWKTHSAAGPAGPTDPTWNLIGPLHENTLFFTSGESWIDIFNTSAAGGNGYIILAHQYMAAVLNKLSGATSTPQVDATLALAAAYFAGKPAGVTEEDNKTLNNTLKSWAAILESFNTGATGPGHCDDQESVS